MKILQLNKINKSKVNLKPIVDALPVGVISDMLIYKIEKNEEENDENISTECMQFIKYLGVYYQIKYMKIQKYQIFMSR